MTFPRSVIVFLLITMTAHVAFPSERRSQVHPMVDPRIPLYVSQDAVSDTLTISLADVQAVSALHCSMKFT